jgi:NAD(P)-dependent dehydrogenase (short-subunit alcohol dehydrogenase family)
VQGLQLVQWPQVLCGSRQESADNAVAKLKTENPDAKLEVIAPDLTSLASAEAAFKAVAEKYGRTDILVSCSSF